MTIGMLHFVLYNNMHFTCIEAIECMNTNAYAKSQALS